MNSLRVHGAANTIYQRWMVGKKMVNHNDGVNYTIGVVKRFPNGHVHVRLFGEVSED